MALQHLRSSTANKRPTPAAMSDGQIAINTEATSPGLFFKSASGSLVKVGPVHVGTTAPNASPASGGEAGNTLGEQWLDTTGGTYVFKVWDGSAWRSETGTFVDVNGDTMTGALGIIAGSASTPGLFFSGDANTGIYSPGADQVAISTGGTGRITIDGSGNVNIDSNTLYVDATNNRVGIGTGNPATKLHLLEGSATDVEVRAGNNQSYMSMLVDSTGVGKLVAPGGTMTFTTGATERLRITSAGNVGIGTSPSSLLHLSASANPVITITDQQTANTSARVKHANGTLTIDSQYNNTSGIIAFSRNNNTSESARFDTSGRLLVGTSTSITTAIQPYLQVQGTGENAYMNAGRWSNDAAGPGLVLGKSRGGAVGTRGAVTNGDVLGEISFWGDNGSAFNSAASIFAATDGTVSGGGANDMPGRLVFTTTADGASSPTERMRLDSVGSVFFAQATTPSPGDGNTTTGACLNAGVVLSISRNSGPTLALNRNTDDGTVARFLRQGLLVGRIDVTTIGTSYITSSDYRLKENVVDLDGAIARLSQLPVHRFNFIADPDTVVDGFLAHEAAEVVPECVTGEKDAVDDDGNPVYQGIDQSKLVPLLTAALQEAVAKIESLESRLTAAGI